MPSASRQGWGRQRKGLTFLPAGMLGAPKKAFLQRKFWGEPKLVGRALVGAMTKPLALAVRGAQVA
jgi:hypothetical protein